MIYEYAVEPALVAEWARDRREFRYFYEQFGLGTPRIMSEFPLLKKWRKLFREACVGITDLDQQRLTILYERLTERVVRRESSPYDGTVSWLDNATNANAQYEFQAILTRENASNHPKALSPEMLDHHSLWKVDKHKQSCCPRRSENMATLLCGLLANSSEIHFIDPYFNPGNQKNRKPLAAFLDILTRHRKTSNYPSIIVHADDHLGSATFRMEARSLAAIIPSGMHIQFKQWSQRAIGLKFHERFVLTDIGGVKVGPGLDIDNCRDGENFEAMLLERNFYEQQWNDYIQHPAFDPVQEEPITVTGTKQPGSR